MTGNNRYLSNDARIEDWLQWTTVQCGSYGLM